MEVGDLHHPRSCSPEGETVCAALARHENTLRDAIREMHLDISSFKLGVERRLEEAVNLSGPLGRAVAQLQQENRQLRTQLQALTRQVELLSGALSDHSSWVKDRHQEVKEVFYGKGQAHLHVQPCSLGGHAHLNSQSSPPPATTFSPHPSASSPVTSRGSSLVSSSSSPSTTRFSSRATFAVSSKNNSIERDEPIDVDLAPTHLQNGHAVAEQSGFVHGKISPPTDVLLEHTAPVSMRMPHLPVTATTKTADVKSSSSVSSPTGPTPLSDTSHLSRSAANATQPLPRAESPPPPARTLAPVRAVGPPSRQEKSEKTSPSPAKSVTYLALQRHDSDDDTSKDRPPRQVGGKRRELVRSQTLPRNIGAQAHRPVFERSDSHHRPADSKPALKRSQSFGVSSASSIKQILLDWCRSKTVGYQKIDIQNFSSSWSDGMAFCALVHSFFPSEFDYESLSPADRKHNFELAFGTAEATAGCDRLIEVDDMMIMGCKPDPMCVFTYVQSLYNHLRRFE